MTLWIIVSAAWGQMPFQFRQLIKTSDKSWGVNVLQCEVVELSLERAAMPLNSILGFVIL